MVNDEVPQVPEVGECAAHTQLLQTVRGQKKEVKGYVWESSTSGLTMRAVLSELVKTPGSIAVWAPSLFWGTLFNMNELHRAGVSINLPPVPSTGAKPCPTARTRRSRNMLNGASNDKARRICG